MTSISNRIKNRVTITAGRLRYEFFKRPATEQQIRSRLLPSMREQLPSGSAFWPALYSEFLKNCPKDIRLCDHRSLNGRMDAIERALAAKISVLGRTFDIPSGYDWNTDLFFDIPWERKYYKAMSDRRPGSDLVLLWMPNRMLHLLDLSFAFAVTRDERYAKEWTRQVVSWCRSNPSCVGMNWRSPLEIGIRLFVFNLGLNELAGSKSIDSNELSVIIPSIIEQGEHLAANFSYWEGNANNHLIGEAATLYAHASMWSLLERSDKWRALGRDTFEREIERQILSDGVSFENALNYHAQVLDFTLLYLLFAHKTNEPAGDRLTGLTERMVRAYLTMLSPRGRLPRFGDDTARELVIMKNADAVEGSVLADPVCFQAMVKSDFCAALGEAPWFDRIINAAVPLENSRMLTASGFVSIRSPRSQLAYAAGIVHEDELHDGHLHSDLGTFELEIDGAMVCVDSGTYLYTYDQRQRDHFKNTRAHNTLLLDGRELMESGATFTWNTVKKAWGLQRAGGNGAACIWSRHLVEGKADSRFAHTRVLIQTGANAWLILDNLEPDGDCCRAESEKHEHEAEVLFHTPLERLDLLAGENEIQFELEMRGDDTLRDAAVAKDSISRWRFTGAGSGPYRMRVVDDRDNPLTWYSPRYGALHYGSTIVGTITLADAATVCHVLSGREGDSALPCIECGDRDVMVKFAEPRDEWRCVFSPFRIERNGIEMTPVPVEGQPDRNR